MSRSTRAGALVTAYFPKKDVGDDLLQRAMRALDTTSMSAAIRDALRKVVEDHERRLPSQDEMLVELQFSARELAATLEKVKNMLGATLQAVKQPANRRR